jgi:hypothetical protein
MHFPTLLSLVGATGALSLSSPAPINNTRIAFAAIPALMGSADIDLDELGSEGLAKRKAMTYCANQQSAPGRLLRRPQRSCVSELINIHPNR